MSSEAAAVRTPGAKRAGAGEYHFQFGNLDRVEAGRHYSTAFGACVEGDRMIVALMRMPAGTGAEPHSHPNEQWIYVVEGKFIATIDSQEIEAKAGTLLYFPSNVVHSVKATPEADGVFFTVKDASFGLQGIKAA
jgi:quercetin dioxygenase-like cupin family protein